MHKNNITLFLIAAIFLASRVVLIIPDAIEKKSKRIVFVQEQNSFREHESRQRLILYEKKEKLPEKEILNSTCCGQVDLHVGSKSESVIYYSGTRILASPGEPDDFFFC